MHDDYACSPEWRVATDERVNGVTLVDSATGPTSWWSEGITDLTNADRSSSHLQQHNFVTRNHVVELDEDRGVKKHYHFPGAEVLSKTVPVVSASEDSLVISFGPEGRYTGASATASVVVDDDGNRRITYAGELDLDLPVFFSKPSKRFGEHTLPKLSAPGSEIIHVEQNGRGDIIALYRYVKGSKASRILALRRCEGDILDGVDLVDFVERADDERPDLTAMVALSQNSCDAIIQIAPLTKSGGFGSYVLPEKRRVAFWPERPPGTGGHASNTPQPVMVDLGSLELDGRSKLHKQVTSDSGAGVFSFDQMLVDADHSFKIVRNVLEPEDDLGTAYVVKAQGVRFDLDYFGRLFPISFATNPRSGDAYVTTEGSGCRHDESSLCERAMRRLERDGWRRIDGGGAIRMDSGGKETVAWCPAKDILLSFELEGYEPLTRVFELAQNRTLGRPPPQLRGEPLDLQQTRMPTGHVRDDIADCSVYQSIPECDPEGPGIMIDIACNPHWTVLEEYMAAWKVQQLDIAAQDGRLRVLAPAASNVTDECKSFRPSSPYLHEALYLDSRKYNDEHVVDRSLGGSSEGEELAQLARDEAIELLGSDGLNLTPYSKSLNADLGRRIGDQTRRWIENLRCYGKPIEGVIMRCRHTVFPPRLSAVR